MSICQSFGSLSFAQDRLPGKETEVKKKGTEVFIQEEKKGIGINSI